MLLSETSQSERPTKCMISSTWPWGKGKIMETIIISMDDKGLKRGERDK